jgi:two-component system, OmpR family, phosphate regulon sensor histidine kinase PhoR
VKNIQIRRLWLLVALCLVGINAFQGYWLWRQYKTQQHNFTIAATRALAQATQQERLGAAAQLLPQFEAIREIDIKMDTFRRKNNVPPRDTVVMVSLSSIKRAKPLQQRLIEIDSLFKTELLQLGIREPYHIDTISRFPSPMQHTITVNASKIDMRIQSDERMVMIMADDNEEKQDTGRFIRVNAPLYFGQSIFVEATFRRHNYHVLASVAGTLMASLLLTLLTAGAFFYLLYIIQQQKKLAALKSDFISAMTHELQTPIATSTAAIEALQHFKALEDPGRTAAYLEIAQSQLTQLSGMVDQTLRLAAEEREGFTLRPQPVDLDELMPGILQRVTLAAGREVQCTFDNGLRAQVTVDAEHFTWAVQNLLDNAIKYCPADRIPRVQVRSVAAGAHWQIAVSDNGPGIPESYRSRLFERFFRVPANGNVKGFGLGLYIVQRIAEGHGGRVFLQNSSDQGSTFVLEIPG